MSTFFAQVDAWTRKSEKRLEAVFKTATQSVIADAQTPRAKGGRMPVDTGFLRNSGGASLSGFGGGTPEFSLVIAKAKLGDTVYFGWSAEYAPYVEFGARGRTPAAFMRGAAQKWPQFVAAAVRQAKSIG